MKSTISILPFLLPGFAAAIKLSDFAALPSSVTSSKCTSTYNSDIQNCSDTDFQNGAQCSPDCITGLIIKGKQIQTDCLGAVTGEDSLLNYAFHSQLAPAVCRNVLGGAPTSTTTSSSAPSSAAASSSTSTPSSTSTMSTSTTSSTQPSSTSMTSSTSMIVPTDAAPSPTSGASGFRTTAYISSTSTTPLTTYTRQPQADGGGGSPFQFAGAANAVQVSSWSLISASLVWLILMIR